MKNHEVETINLRIETGKLSVDLAGLINSQIAKHPVVMRDDLKDEGYKGGIVRQHSENGAEVNDLLLTRIKSQIRELY